MYQLMTKNLIKMIFSCAAILIGALCFGDEPLSEVPLSEGAASESLWTHSVGVVLSPAYHSMKVRDEGCKNVFVPRVSAVYYAEKQGGFCIDGTLSAGVALSKDVKLESEDQLASAFSLGASLGFGYAFHPTEKLTLSPLATVSLDWSHFKFTKEFSAKLSTGTATDDWTQTDDFLTFGIGAELISAYKCTERMSLFSACAVRFFDAGNQWRAGTNQGHDYDDSFEIRGNFSVVPSLGLSWIL